MSTHGKWIASHHEERWTDREEFDTRDEAIAYALSELAPGYDVDRVYTGQIDQITPDEIARAGLGNVETIIENVDEWLYETIGDEVEYNLPSTRTQDDDLMERLRAAFVEWMRVYSIAPCCYRIEHVKSHEVPPPDALRDNHALGKGCKP